MQVYPILFPVTIGPEESFCQYFAKHVGNSFLTGYSLENENYNGEINENLTKNKIKLLTFAKKVL